MTSPKSVDNWKYARLPLTADPAELGPFREFVELWNDKKGPAGRLPTRRDFDFLNFRPWWGRISIVKFDRDPFKIYFDLWGTQLVQWWGTDLTGTIIVGDESGPLKDWEVEEQRYMLAMYRDPFIGMICGDLEQHHRSFMKIAGIDLPLADDDGVSHVISLHTEIDPSADIDTVLPDCTAMTLF